VKTAAIVPAFNEAGRIQGVISVLERVPFLDEVIVVDDGSTDDTFSCIHTANGIRAIRLATNAGKGGALAAGVRQTDAEVLVFLDADLVGLQPDHVRQIFEPVHSGHLDVCVGIVQGGRTAWTDNWQRWIPAISGQRAMRREVFLGAPGLERTRFGVEVSLSRYARLRGLKVGRVTLRGVTHVIKEEKLGAVRGFWARLMMYGDMARCLAAVPVQDGSRKQARPEM
jgi:glycosyltransferase involved in cell wall biosynthesis